MDSSSLLPHATTMLDLNDDCLIEVCRHMKLMDLSAFADVCGRFRSSAQAFFAISEYKNLDIQEIYCGEHSENKLLRMSRLLRNFGASIVNISNSVTFGDINYLVLIELILRYCGENLIDFEFASCSVTDEITLLMRPLLGRLQKLSFAYCDFYPIMWDVLPLWASELQELKFDVVADFLRNHSRHFDLQFPKLTKLSLLRVSTRWSSKFLALNSQLRELELDSSLLEPNGRMLKLIAEKLTQLETLRLKFEFSNLHSMGLGTEYLGAVSNLSSLEVEFHDCELHDIVSAIRTMGEHKVPLKRLKLRYWRREMAAEVHLNNFVEAVFNLKKLEALSIYCAGLKLNAVHINHMCKHLTQLKALDLVTKTILWTAENILECVRIAKNLQSLELRQYAGEEQTICLDVDFFNKMVNLLEKQGKQRCLSIKLKGGAYTKNIPDDLTRAKRHVLLISISGLYN